MSKEIQEKSFINRGRYELPNPETGKPARWTRVTKFVDCIDDKENLIAWISRHVAKGVAGSDDLITRAAAASLTNRGELDRICREAKKLAGGDQAADDGTFLHALSEAFDRREDVEVPPKWKGHVLRYADLIDNGPLEVIPEYIERIVVVPELMVAGTFDRLMRVKYDVTVAFPSGRTVELQKGDVVVVDVKTSKVLEYSQLKFSAQFACYAAARYVFVPPTEDGTVGTYDTLPEIRKDVAFILWLPSTKTEAGIVAVDITAGWEAALHCKKTRDMRNSKKLLATVYVPKIEDVDSYEARISRAESRQDLSDIWNEARSNGFLTPAIEAAGKNRLREIES